MRPKGLFDKCMVVPFDIYVCDCFCLFCHCQVLVPRSNDGAGAKVHRRIYGTQLCGERYTRFGEDLGREW